MLSPGLRWAWRTADTVQFGIDVPEPLIISGLPPFSQRLLPLLDGVRSPAEIFASMESDPAERAEHAEVQAVIERLIAIGVVFDGGLWPGGIDLSPADRDRLAPDVRCASALERFRSRPAARWNALAASQVVMVGASRLGATISRALAGAGVSRLDVQDAHPVTAADVSSGGFTPHDVGRRRSELVSLHAERAAEPPPGDTRQRLVVVTDAVDTHDVCRSLAATDDPHLVVSCREMIGRVGPLVEPGRSPCFFCRDLARRDVDAGWSDVWRQRVTDPSPDADSVLVGITAHIAAAHVVDWLTGGRPPSWGGFVEIVAPHGAATTRTLTQHPECGCAWPDSPASPTMGT
jgi:hypothetical protein